MKFLQSIGVAAIAASLSATANATVFSVSGALTDYEVDSSYWLASSYSVAFNPASPAFTGSWMIDLLGSQLSGDADFESYWAHTEITGIGTTDVERPHDYHTLDTSTATFSYDSLNYTLSITGALLNIGGTSGDCTATGWLVCDPPGTVYEFDNTLSLQLVFDPTLQTFTGTSVNTRTFEGGFIDHTTWTFSGSAVGEVNPVPLPPTLWLLGTGLLGLVGANRLRRR